MCCFIVGSLVSVQHAQTSDLSSILLKNSTYAGTWEDPTSGMKYVTGGGIKIKFKGTTDTYTPWIKVQFQITLLVVMEYL